MKRYLFPSTMTLLLISLSTWLLFYAMDQRRVSSGTLANGQKNIEALYRFPEVLYAVGEQAWRELNVGRAAALFREVVVRNPLHMGAWIKLAEADIEIGDESSARKIAVFCDTRIARVLRWKRALTLLAHDLAMEEIFKQNINYLADRQKWLSDIFYLLDIHTQHQTDQALAVLNPGNRPIYLKWLIRWGKADAAQTAWTAIEEDGNVTDELLETYVNFLVSRKQVVLAAALWRRHTAVCGMTNPGFENEITGKGFDWRIVGRLTDNSWQADLVYDQSYRGSHSLRVSFYGRENISWNSIYQVVPVTPQQPCQLTFWWKSKNITTDQGPFVEVSGYDAGGLLVQSPMTLGSHDWVAVSVAFTPPVACHAVLVRLRRNASLRFDNKIQGVLWVDEFKIASAELNKR